MTAAMTRPRRRRVGRYIVVAGPDGTGKSTVAEHLREVVMVGRPVLHLHHRPRVLGGLTAHDGPVTEPHKHPAYPWLISLAKVFYLYADYLLGWVLVLRPHLRAGGDVLLERGWWDLLVDPARYRLRPHTRLVRVLGALLPAPTTTLVLLADVEVLAARTEELGGPELGRQLRAWRALAARLGAVDIDVSEPLPQVLRHAEDALRSTLAGASAARGGWIALPRPSAPRWILPRQPRTATVNALRVYSPVTVKGVVGWSLASVLARLRAAAVLPSAPTPQQILDAVADILPPGGTVAIGRGSHAGQCVAMVLDRDGVCVAFVKLVDDASGEAALAAEAAAVQAMGPLLPEPLHAPALLDHSPRRLVFEAVPWLPRATPWRLPPEVARGLGRLYATGARDGFGPAHGDCGPWNLLRARGAWYLVDWSEATSEAPVFSDLWHYLVQAHALTGLPTRRAILQGLVGHGHVGAVVRAYSAGANVSPTLAPEGLVGYLQRSWSRLDPDAEDGRRGRSVRAALLVHLGQEPPP